MKMVTKSCSLFFEKKILSLYSSPVKRENWLANAAQTDDEGNESVRSSAKKKRLLSQIFERFLVQPMPPHLSIQRLVVHFRFNSSHGNGTLIFNQQAPEIFFFAAQQPLFKGKFTIAIGYVVAIENSLRWRRQIDVLNHFAL